MGSMDIDCSNCYEMLKNCKCGETETWCDEHIICPYCGHLNNPADSDGMAYSEDTYDYDCGDCGKNFELEVYVTYTWTARIK